MEYVPGRNLSALVKNDGPLPVAKAVNTTRRDPSDDEGQGKGGADPGSEHKRLL